MTLFEGYKCNKLCEIKLEGKLLMGAQENNLQKLPISQNMKSYAWQFTSVLSIPLKFESYFLRFL